MNSIEQHPSGLRSLLNFSIQQTIFINIVFIGMVMYGAFVSLPSLPVDRYPNIEFGEVQINTTYPGATAEEVERLVSQPLEESLRGMKYVEFVRSTSMFGRSELYIKFEDDTDFDSLYEEMRLRVLSIQGKLPIVNGDPLLPTFSKINVDEWLPVIQVNLISENVEKPLSRRSLHLMAKELRAKLDVIDGVKEIKINGEPVEQFILAIDPEKLVKFKLDIVQLTNAIRDSGHAVPVGSIETKTGKHNLRIDQRYRHIEDLYKVIIRKDGEGNFVYLEDVLDLEQSKVQPINDLVILTVNGMNAVSCKILKMPWANSNDIKQKVLNISQEFIQSRKQEGLKLQTTLDSTIKIKDGMGVLQNSLMMSLILVMLTLFLFLSHVSKRAVILMTALSMSGLLIIIKFQEYTSLQIAILAISTFFVFLTCRAAILTVTGIAFSFLGSLIIFQIFQYSINEITLLGFVITSGIIVDDAIIVLENIQRHRESGKKIIEAALRGTEEVFWPITSATLTTCFAFLPMLLMTGSVGDFFSLIPITVTIALAMSLVECLFMLPLHTIEVERYFGMGKMAGHEGDGIQAFLSRPGLAGKSSRFYHSFLTWCLENRLKSLGIIFLLFLMSIAVLAQSAIAPMHGYRPLLKLKFFPSDESIFNVIIRMPDGTTLDQTDQYARKISRFLSEKGEGQIANVTGLSGMMFDSSYRPIYNSVFALLQAEFPERAKRSFPHPKQKIEELRIEIEKNFEKDGIGLEIMPAPDGPPVGMPIHIRITGISDKNIIKLAKDIEKELLKQSEMGTLRGIIDLHNDSKQKVSMMSFKLDPNKVKGFNLNISEVQNHIAYLFDGLYVGEYRRSDDDIPIRMRMSRETSPEPSEMLETPITTTSNGYQIFFKDLGEMKQEELQASLIRRDFHRTINLTGNIAENSNVSPNIVSEFVQQWYLKHSENYPGTSIAFGGEAESTGKSFKSLIVAFALAVFLIYLVLSMQFKSYVQPMMIMSNILFSFTGVVLMMGSLGALSLILPKGTILPERSLFTVQSFIAFIGLTGLVINDAIVLIDFINKNLKQSNSLNEALILSGLQRIRPIIMTTCTTISGLLPLAIGLPEFSITWGPFATCFIAGLSMSTAMTILIIPVIFSLQSSFVNFFIHKKKFKAR